MEEGLSMNDIYMAEVDEAGLRSIPHQSASHPACLDGYGLMA